MPEIWPEFNRFYASIYSQHGITRPDDPMNMKLLGYTNLIISIFLGGLLCSLR